MKNQIQNDDICEQEYRQYYSEIQDDGNVGKTDEPLPTIPVVVEMTPNYTITIATLDELCSWFKSYTGSWAAIKDIKKSFEKRQKKGIHDEWMQRFMEAIKTYGPTSKNARLITVHNKVPTIGRTEIAKAITGTGATINANYIALGSGTNAPADGDTTLQTEFVRGGFTAISYTNNVVYLDKFFGSAEAGSRTITEAGIFMGATATANSGVLLSRVNINEVTTANETMTINATITLTSAT